MDDLSKKIDEFSLIIPIKTHDNIIRTRVLEEAKSRGDLMGYYVYDVKVASTKTKYRPEFDGCFEVFIEVFGVQKGGSL